MSTAKLAPALTVRVTTVADGDTIRADNNGERETARLIGMDTPESPNLDLSCVQRSGGLPL